MQFAFFASNELNKVERWTFLGIVCSNFWTEKHGFFKGFWTIDNTFKLCYTFLKLNVVV